MPASIPAVINLIALDLIGVADFNLGDAFIVYDYPRNINALILK